MVTKIILLALLVAIYSVAKPLKPRNPELPLPTGTYLAKVRGDEGVFQLTWVLKADSTYSLNMASADGKGRKVVARGRWAFAQATLHLFDSEHETQDGWVPLEWDPIPVLERNDSLLRVRLLHNEAAFIRKK